MMAEPHILNTKKTFVEDLIRFEFDNIFNS